MKVQFSIDLKSKDHREGRSVISENEKAKLTYKVMRKTILQQCM